VNDYCVVGRCREQNHDGLRDGLILVLVVILLWFALTWASSNAVVAEEHARLVTSEGVVSTQATRIALMLRPTPTPSVSSRALP
jgi:hypothetical protein